MRITDAQFHVWEPDRPDRPWDPNLKTHLETPFSVEQLLGVTAEGDVDRAVLVPPRFMGYVNPNGYALEAAGKWPDRFAVMGRFDPRRPDLSSALAGWLQQPGMRGVRFTLRVGAEAGWLRDGTMDRFWPEAARLGVPVAIQACEDLPALHPVIERYPDLSLIVDHMGLPSRGPDPYANVESVLPMAKYPNVVVKLSGLLKFTSEAYPYPVLQGYIRRAYDAFGPQRLAWGSDYTTVIGRRSYRETVDLIREACDFLSPEDREWILDRTISRVLKWG